MKNKTKLRNWLDKNPAIKRPIFRAIRQFWLIRVWAFNTSYNLLPFIFLRRAYLKVMGFQMGQGTVVHSPVTFLGLKPMSIGAHSTINPHCILDNRCEISIGENVNIAHGCSIYTMGHEIRDPWFTTTQRPTTLEDYVALFAHVLVMPGVTLERGCVAYPGSVVVKSAPAYTILGGNPARPLGIRPSDLRYTIHNDYWFSH